ncbi:MAG: universal stress protein [Acidobacteriota bacterium]
MTILRFSRIRPGTHGTSGLERVLLGNTAEEVIRRSPLLVFTVRGACRR